MVSAESPDDGKKEAADKERIQNKVRAYAPYLTLGFQLAAAVLVFFFAGYWFDNKFHTSPMGILFGVGAGFTGGLYKFIKSVTELNSGKKDE